ncbi:peptidyl-prolyl cis-trans isomerase CWC27 -like [Asbolus verrucosus]|uniref:Spliceosome-associated protein CWC27 homolog n=1 Tax=Asbolus verrucosus TaxID=1661398 RepID=A0A482V943_ASBVE|nr:peptidyl-prolyl cis-trans isomerase CWC27 -like [Asbolus verrucosus]
MSSVYILEPPTTGKVLLKTTVGDIDVELWAKETPKTCRNFIQLCLEGYYDNTIFHRVVKGFIVQGGDPNGDGTGGESIYGEPFKDEFHQRLRFSRRGLLAMANAGKDDNGSQFFFTLGATPELQDKHTIFGKITGETIFNMLKLEEGLVRDERPVYPHKIIKVEVLNNPFADIEPRIKEVEIKEKKKKEKKPGVKNFKLLSFGAEAEEDEEESTRENEKFVGKGKSTHDVLDDPKLSSKTEEVDDENSEEETDPEVQLENIRKKLKKEHKKPISVPATSAEPLDTYESILEEQRQEIKKKKYEEIQKEIQNVKKEYHKNKLKKGEEKAIEEKEIEKNETVQEYKNEYDKYTSKKNALPKKGAGREQFTLELLEKFKKKLQSMKEGEENKDETVDNEEEAW